MRSDAREPSKNRLQRVLQELGRWQPAAAIAGVLILALYTYYTRCQVQELIRGNIDANRAWLWEKALTLPVADLEKAGLPTWIQMDVSNFGRGPAIDVVTNLSWAVAPPEQKITEFKWNFVLPDKPGPFASKAVIMPGDTHYPRIEFGDTPDTRAKLNAVFRGQLILYITASVDYVDQYGVSRHSEWVHWYVPERKTWPFFEKFNMVK